eukprot:1461092-Rhodomonas_salina.2
MIHAACSIIFLWSTAVLSFAFGSTFFKQIWRHISCKFLRVWGQCRDQVRGRASPVFAPTFKLVQDGQTSS